MFFWIPRLKGGWTDDHSSGFFSLYKKNMYIIENENEMKKKKSDKEKLMIPYTFVHI